MTNQKTIQWNAQRTRSLLNKKFGVPHTLATIKHFQSVLYRLNFAADRINRAKHELDNEIKTVAELDDLHAIMFSASELSGDFDNSMYVINRELIAAVHDIHCIPDCLAQGLAMSAKVSTLTKEYANGVVKYFKKNNIPLTKGLEKITTSQAFLHLREISNKSKHSAIISSPLSASNVSFTNGIPDHKIIFDSLNGFPRVNAVPFMESLIDFTVENLKTVGEEVDTYLEGLPDAA
ncbi:hypothetical protein EXV95_05700 [Acidovorax sp. JMULE5]|uniref:hypothetical protein n=1 Tax=Acidovorax sp. JMULE5 TaxID=2518343 RepID=UPI0015A012BA|nr:hypothetical protein [Acidovorax sp. JMULE5]QLA80178.1 hypothetical protein EXV95_05700 [Acidovorax sp. JMULE5]